MNNKKSFKGFLKFFFSMKGIEEDINEEYMQKFNKIQKIIDEQVWELPLNKEKIETLEKLMEEYQLVYFIKSSSFNILSDYPCMGNFESRLRYSEIEGPYELAPKVKKGVYDDEHSVYVFESLIPTNSIPVELEKISLIEYGTQVDRNSLLHLGFSANQKMNPERMTEIGKRALEKLSKMDVNIKKISDSVYQASVDDCVLGFRLFSHHFYPEVNITIFGKNKEPHQLIQELGLDELEKQFPFWCKDVGIKYCTRRGFAYNLSLKDPDLNKILAGKNIIL